MILTEWPNSHEPEGEWVYHSKRGDRTGRFVWLPMPECQSDDSFFIPAFMTDCGHAIFYRAIFEDGESFEKLVNTNERNTMSNWIERLEEECAEVAATQVALAARIDKLAAFIYTEAAIALGSSVVSAMSCQLNSMMKLANEYATYRGCIETRLSYGMAAKKETTS